MAGVEGTIVATARPFIVADLHRFDLSAWIFVSYQLTQAVSTNLWGKFSDLLGRKKLYQLSLAIFMLGSFTALVLSHAVITLPIVIWFLASPRNDCWRAARMRSLSRWR